MPELPEVETTLRGILPAIEGCRTIDFISRIERLRWPIPPELGEAVRGQPVLGGRRRGKYLLLEYPSGYLLLHLGMSGSLRIVAGTEPLRRHDHADIVLDNHKILRFNDPRRFGAILWIVREDLNNHPLLRLLGPEPLADEFDGGYLYRRSRGRSQCVKSFIMDSHTVVGVGNIYAAEALFLSGVRPLTAAGKVSRGRYQRLAVAIKAVLAGAIARGGTTLRDFVGGDGKPGYFRQQLAVYGRQGEACRRCGGVLRGVRIGGRASVYCPRCQR